MYLGTLSHFRYRMPLWTKHEVEVKLLRQTKPATQRFCVKLNGIF